MSKDKPTYEELREIANSAVKLFSGEYSDLQGPIRTHLDDEQICKLENLSAALIRAGYSWETLC